ncbi:hypothetical protein Taro_037288 [Colocasia esculenta]|uniref:CCHC-type domain-containing protein n=1 Tax=Colocasia esculenta TaxID=4460 RepID=A0A843W5B0_COLES|nr:hypothetical protein [Colocasia esculenta]
MLPNENITQMYNIFTNITVGLNSLGKNLTNEETVRKILRSLTHSWTPKVTVIKEAHDLTELSIDKLIGSLIAHEINMERFLKSSSKKKMSNALKVLDSFSSSSEDSKEKSEESNDEAMLSRRLQRILAKKKKYRSKRYFKMDKKSKEPTCYKCKQLGHFKIECPKLKRKDQADKHETKKDKERKFRKYKKKAMAAAWDNEEATSSHASSSESEEEEQVNLALMAGLDQDYWKPRYYLKRRLFINELGVEKRLLHAILTTIVTPSPGTHSSILAWDDNLLFWAIHRHQGTSTTPPDQPLADRREVVAHEAVQAGPSLEQDPSEDIINQVLRDLKGKAVAHEEEIPSPTPYEPAPEEEFHHVSQPPLETQPRSQGETSRTIDDVLNLKKKRSKEQM